MLTEYNKIKPLIANWVHNEMFQYKDLGSDEVVGVVVSSSSVIKKTFMLHRISNVIAREGLDLIVKEDNTQEFSNRFIITKKNKNKNWFCNSCGFSEYTDAVSQDELDSWLQCSNCGENEFHLE